MIGTEVERQGIIRHGAKMVTAVSEATVPKVSVIVRKAYGAGLYAMCGPAFEPEATIALPTAKIAVMGPEAAVNAVFANQIAAIEDADERAAFVAEQRRLYEEDVDLYRLASELVDRRRGRLPRPAPRGRPAPRPGRRQGPRTSPTAATASPRSEWRPCAPCPAAARRRSSSATSGPRDGLQPEAPGRRGGAGAADRGARGRRRAPHRGGGLRVAEGRAGDGRRGRGDGRSCRARRACATPRSCRTCEAPSWPSRPTSTSSPSRCRCREAYNQRNVHMSIDESAGRRRADLRDRRRRSRSTPC